MTTILTLGELAEALGAELTGNAEQPVHRVSHPKQAASAEDLALVLDKAIIPLLQQKPVQTALVPLECPDLGIPNTLKVKRPKVALAKLLALFGEPVHVEVGVHPSASVDPMARLGENVAVGPLCRIGPGVVIGDNTRLVSHVSIGANAIVGEDCLFHPGVVVGDGVHIGNRVILQPNAVIGSDGFSYVTAEAGSVESARATGNVGAQNTQIIRIDSIGTVVLEDDVEIGANACVDRATLGETRIKRGAKIDNQVQIAHNVVIGENCLFAAQVGIAGSVTVGDRVVMGGQVGVKDHTYIGDDAIIISKTGVTDDVEPKTLLIGLHGKPRKEFLRQEMNIKRLSGYYEKINQLSERIEALEARLKETEEAPQHV